MSSHTSADLTHRQVFADIAMGSGIEMSKEDFLAQCSDWEVIEGRLRGLIEDGSGSHLHILVSREVISELLIQAAVKPANVEHKFAVLDHKISSTPSHVIGGTLVENTESAWYVRINTVCLR